MAAPRTVPDDDDVVAVPVGTVLQPDNDGDADDSADGVVPGLGDICPGCVT